MKKILVLALAALAPVLMAGPRTVTTIFTVTPPASSRAVENRLRTTLGTHPGVSEVVCLEGGTRVSVTFSPTRTDHQTIIRVLHDGGFEAVPVDSIK